MCICPPDCVHALIFWLFLQVSSIANNTDVTLSQHQKFRKSQIISQELASLASEVGMNQFKQRFMLLKTLRDTWANGQEATLEPIQVDDEGLYAFFHFII